MGFGLVLAGMLFLFNPVVGIFDVLPDFIGCILIYCGLRQGAVAYPTFADVRRAFVPVLWLGAVKLIASVLVELFGTNTSASNTTSLIITFVFCCLELVFLLPAVRRLLDGIVYAGSRCDSKAVFHHVQGYKRFTTVFLVCRAVLPVIPEFSALSSYENIGMVSSGVEFNYADYKSLFIVLTVFLLAVLGLIWLIWTICYFTRILHEKKFLNNFCTQYQEQFTTNPHVFVRRALSIGLLLLIVATFFNLDFYVALDDQSSYDEDTELVSLVINDWGMVNVIPDILCVGIAAAGLLLLHRQNRNRLLLAGVTTLYGAAAVWSYTQELIFNSRYVIDDIAYFPEAEDCYQTVILSNWVKDGAFIFFLLLLTINLCSIVSAHTGLVVQHPDHIDNGRLSALHRMLHKRLWVAFAFGVLSALASGVCVMQMAYQKPVWMLDFSLSALYAVLTLSALSRMRKETDAHYE